MSRQHQRVDNEQIQWGRRLELNFLPRRRQAADICSTFAASSVSGSLDVPEIVHRKPPEGLQWVVAVHGKKNRESGYASFDVIQIKGTECSIAH